MADVYGLQVFDASGKEIFNSSKGCARYLGSFVPPTEDGSRVIGSPIDGQPVVNLFAYTRGTAVASMQITISSASSIRYSSVWVTGSTINWVGLGAGVEQSRIHYGDSYA